MDEQRRPGGWFVPHDLERPVHGDSTGPLVGPTAVVKDSFDVAGTRTGGGSPEWLAAQEPAARHAGAVAELLEAGATVVGKTVCDEFFYSLTGRNPHYGTPLNVRAPDRVPGGSSSGSAAATAAGVCDVGLGGDTGGSVRVPAAFCGIFGIRPTHGRVNTSGAMAMAPSFDVPGWFAASPGVFRKVGEVLLDGRAERAPITRLVVAYDAFAEANGATREVIQAFLRAAAEDLPSPEAERISDDLDRWRDVFRVVQAWEVWQSFGAFIERERPELGAAVAARIVAAAQVTDAQVAAARERAAEIRAGLRDILRPGTVCAIPTAPAVPPPIDLPEDSMDELRLGCMRLTCIAGLGGLPQVTLPAGRLACGPIGISFVAWPGGDEELLDLAVSLARHSSPG